MAPGHTHRRLQGRTHPGFGPAQENLTKFPVRGCRERAVPLPLLGVTAPERAQGQGILLVYASVFTLFTTTGEIQLLNEIITAVPVIHFTIQNGTDRADPGLFD